MPGNEKLLLHVIDFCREGRESAEVHDEIVRFVGAGVCTYAPEVVCANLVNAGALAIVANEAEETDGGDGAAEAADDVEAAGAAAEVPDEPASETEAVGAPPAFSYLATDEGLAVVDAQDPEGDRLRCKEPRRYSGFFVKGLESIDAIAFDGAWKTTEVGRDILVQINPTEED